MNEVNLQENDKTFNDFIRNKETFNNFRRKINSNGGPKWFLKKYDQSWICKY